MTRLALAKTLVNGTVTLQGTAFTFTASGSGTGRADRVPEANKIAVRASNTAAITAARASINKILANNSSVLTDLEITSLISNNLSTTVKVFIPIELSSIAISTDGVNYTLKPNTIIGSNQWLKVPNGISLKTGTYPFVNNGYFQVGEPSSSSPTTALTEYSSNCTNNGIVEVYYGSSSTIDRGVKFENLANSSAFYNYGTCTNNGTMTNSGQYCGVNTYAGGLFNNNSGAVINNNGAGSYVDNSGGTFNNNSGAVINNTTSSGAGNLNNGTFTNTGIITNSGWYSYVNNYDTSLFTNNGTITNSGQTSSVVVSSGTFSNNGLSIINNTGKNSYILNGSGAVFYNVGAITNTGSGSYTTNSGTWTEVGTCTGNCQL